MALAADISLPARAGAGMEHGPRHAPPDSEGPVETAEQARKRRRLLWEQRPLNETLMSLGPKMYVEEAKTTMLVVL